MSDVEGSERAEGSGRPRFEVPAHPPRFRQRVPTPPLAPAWRWGFPLLLVVAGIWSAFLVLEGFDRVLESEEGETLEVVTDPTAPGFEAFVEQTWSLLAVAEDDGGSLTGVAVLAVADRQNGGGTVLVLPPEAPVGGSTLLDTHAGAGVDGLRAAVVGLLDVEVGGTALLTPSRLASLAEPAGPVEVASGGAAVSGAEAAGWLAQASDDPMQRVARQAAWWRAWLGTVGAADDPSDRLPAIAIEIVDVVRAISSGERRVLAWPALEAGADWVGRTVVETFPFPIPAAPGARTTVRLLNGHGDFTMDEPARRLLVAAGAEVSVVGNHEDFDIIGTRVLYREPALEAEAARLAVVVGGGTLHDPLMSPVADLTVIVGADFAVEHGGTPAGASGDAVGAG